MEMFLVLKNPIFFPLWPAFPCPGNQSCSERVPLPPLALVRILILFVLDSLMAWWEWRSALISLSAFFSLLFFCDYINMTLSSFLVVHGNVVPILERRHVPLRSSYSPFPHSPPSPPSILFVYFFFFFVFFFPLGDIWFWCSCWLIDELEPEVR